MTQLDQFIAILSDEINYLEKKSNANLDDKTANAGSGNYTKYWRDIYPAFQAQPWCACFVSWAARKAGIPETVIPTFYSCSVGVNWFQSRGQYTSRAQSAPKRGDIVFFGSNAPEHVGVVSKVDGGKVYTIEGNTSGGSTLIANGGSVAAKSYTLTYTKILGYASPKYETNEVDEMAAMIEEIAKMAGVTPSTVIERLAAIVKMQPIALAGDLKVKFENAKLIGITDGSRPGDYATRAEAAAMIYKGLKK